jgi:nucleoid-associated protein YgaU
MVRTAKSASSHDLSERTTARLYRVQEHDDLRSIAKRLYGDPDLWIYLHRANVEVISRNGGIQPGQVLLVPEL